MKRIEYAEFLNMCEVCDIQPHHLFACLRKTLGISQAKLAYRMDKEGVNQNTISKYEHKNNITAEHEYQLWSYILYIMKHEFHLRRKTDNIRYAATILAAFNLYILRYADAKQAAMVASLLTEGYRLSFAT